MTTNVDGATTAYVLLPQAHAPSAALETERTTRTVLPALLTGGLLWLCYFPVAWGWLGWVALVPLLVLVRAEARPRRIYLSAFLAGSLFFGPVLQWLRVADEKMYYTWAALAIYCSLYFPLGVGLLRLLDRRTRLPLVLTLPIVWTALEYLRAHLMTGFPWYFLSHTQHDCLPVIQIADLGGAYAVTFLVAAINAVLFEVLCRLTAFHRLFGLPSSAVAGWRSLAGQAAFAGMLLTGTLVYGAMRLQEGPVQQGPLVALLQSNLDQRIKEMGTDEAFRRMFQHNRDLSNYACTQDQKPDLIVWPETSLPGEWLASATDRNVIQKGEAREVQSLIVDRWKTNVLLGVTSRVSETGSKDRVYNSAVLVRPDRTVAGRYDKMHRVPFGEYVPLQDWMPWMAKLAPYDYDYGVEPGKEWTRFDLDRERFGVVICYEDTDPELSRAYACGTDSQCVDFLLNISNDGWFDGSSEHEQHLAICRFRAIECRRALARAVNMGISAVIDGNGRVLQPERGYLVRPLTDSNGHVRRLEPGYLVRQDCSFQAWNWKGLPGEAPAGDEVPVERWADFKKAAGVMLTHIPIDDRVSWYASFGDWLPQGCWLFLGLGVVVSCFRPRRGER